MELYVNEQPNFVGRVNHTGDHGAASDINVARAICRVRYLRRGFTREKIQHQWNLNPII